MKQKVVIKITPKKETCRFTTPQKALQIAARFTGVESVALAGDDKMQVEVTGDGVDAVELMICLRKKMGNAVIQSVGPPPEKKKPPEKKQEENKPSPPIVIYPPGVCTSSYPYPYAYYHCYPCPTEPTYCQDYSCTIL